MRGNQDTLEYGRGSYTFSRMYNILRAPRDRGAHMGARAPPPQRKRSDAEGGQLRAMRSTRNRACDFWSVEGDYGVVTVLNLHESRLEL